MNLELILMSENDIAEFKKNVQCAFQKGFEDDQEVGINFPPLDFCVVMNFKKRSVAGTYLWHVSGKTGWQPHPRRRCQSRHKYAPD